MALTLTRVSQELSGFHRTHVYDFVFDSSYPTGGEALTAADVGLRAIETLDVVEVPDGYTFSYDRTNSKLQAFYGDANASDAPAVEVANAADLALVNGRFIARGN
jgi:hypothetical protein